VEVELNTLNASADVCTPKRTRRTAAPKLPSPALPGWPVSPADYVTFWTVAVQRDEAELVAFTALMEATHRKLDLSRDGKNAALGAALSSAKGHLTDKLKESREKLAAAKISFGELA